MKRLFLTLAATVVAMCSYAQFQLTNAGFEEWETVETKKNSSTLRCDEPVRWSSFYDATGGAKSMGIGNDPQIRKSQDVREGSAGQYSAKINARSVLGVVAQGNLTNGCVNMGSTRATDASGNYNYINEEREDQAMRFSGHPDAVSLWVKVYKKSGTAGVAIWLTTKGYFQDPVSDKNPNVGVAVAHAVSKDLADNHEWKEYVIPFEVDDASQDPYYCLTTISTSAIPGSGNAADSLFVDDVKMLYYSEAKKIMYDGKNIIGGKCMGEYDESKLEEVVMTGRAATYETSYDAETQILTVTVKGENISEEPDNYHVYTVHFTGEVATEGYVAPVKIEFPEEPEMPKKPEFAEFPENLPKAPEKPTVVAPVFSDYTVEHAALPEEGGKFALINVGFGKFVNNNNNLTDAPLIWNINPVQGGYQITDGNGKYIRYYWLFGHSFQTNQSQASTLTLPVSTAEGAEGAYLIKGGNNRYLNFESETSTSAAESIGPKDSYYLCSAEDEGLVAYTTALNEYNAVMAAYQESYKKYLADSTECMRVYKEECDAKMKEYEAECESITAAYLAEVAKVYNETVPAEYDEEVTELLGNTNLADAEVWTTNMVTNKSQHFSGDAEEVYYEQTPDQWASSSWAVSANQTIKLPVGHYVLTAVGRSSDKAVATVSVNDITIQFPAKGDTGYGVDVDGKVNFSKEGTYCNDGVGRGWERRMLAFDVLVDTAVVTISFDMESEEEHQWASVCGIHLYSAPYTPQLTAKYDGEDITSTTEPVYIEDAKFDETKLEIEVNEDVETYETFYFEEDEDEEGNTLATLEIVYTGVLKDTHTLKVLFTLPTSVDMIQAAENIKNGDVYDLQGRRVGRITRPGLYIINGAKALVK